MRAILPTLLITLGLIGAGPLAAQDTPAPASAPSALPAALPQVGVRGWDHGTYGRLVFDLAPGIDATAALNGTTLTASFSAPVRLDAAQAMRRLSRIAKGAALSPDGRRLVVTLGGPAALKAERYADKLVLDLTGTPAPQAPAAEATAPAPAAPPEVTPPKIEPPVEPSAPAKPAAAEPEAVKAEPAKPEQAAPTPEPPPEAAAAVLPAPAQKPRPPEAETPTVPPAETAVSHATPAETAPPAHAAPAVGAATVSRRRGPSGVEIEMAFGAPVAAAVFGRGESLWFVFDGPGGAASGALADALTSLGAVAPLDVPGGSGFRLLGRLLPPQVAATDKGWKFLFGAEARPPLRPLVASPRADATGHMRLLVAAPGAHAPLDVPDPDIGGRLLVVPLAEGGAGVVVGGRLPDLEILPTVQGLAFVPLADGLRARTEGEDVVIGRDGAGLTLSDASLAPAMPKPGLGQRAESELDVGRWRLPGPVPETRAGLERAAALAKDDATKADSRLRLARYLVGTGFGAEAIGATGLIEEANPEIVSTPEFRLMRGIARAMQERPTEALADLTMPALEFNPDAALWRGYALAAEGKPIEAHRSFSGVLGAIEHFPPRYQERLLAAAGESALAADDMRAAGDVAADLAARATTAAGKARALVLEGRVAVRRSDGVAARAAFEKALASGERVARVDAELGLIELGLADGSVDREEAIARLDRLRYAWRGDARELAVLRRLADLQLAEGHWREGFETLRLAIKLFPKDPGTPALKETLSTAFRRLFLGGAADAMPPVQAVALYFDYRDLTPLGNDGDEMIRRLADRLVQVDLLDQAKALLNHQVNYRLQGIPKARVAARLALLHLMDHEPAEALALLNGSEQPVLAEATARLRRLLRARALADLGRPGEAGALLAGDASADAATLAAEITWQARDWPAAAAALGRLLADHTPPDHGAPEAPVQSLVLRQAVALTLSGDIAGQKRLAAAWGAAMAETKSADAFTMMTGGGDPEALSTRNLAQTMANVGGAGSFLEELRRRLIAGELGRDE